MSESELTLNTRHPWPGPLQDMFKELEKAAEDVVLS